jgi:hypothetical protein
VLNSIFAAIYLDCSSVRKDYRNLVWFFFLCIFRLLCGGNIAFVGANSRIIQEIKASDGKYCWNIKKLRFGLFFWDLSATHAFLRKIPNFIESSIFGDFKIKKRNIRAK